MELSFDGAGDTKEDDILKMKRYNIRYVYSKYHSDHCNRVLHIIVV